MGYKFPKVVAIVLNYNCAFDTISCVESLLETRYPNLEIIVVDNASEPDDRFMLERLRSKVLKIIIYCKNVGYAAGNNVGIKYALEKINPNYVLIINPDVTVAQDFLIHLINVMEKNKEVGIVAPIQCYWDRPRTVYSAGGRLWWFLGQHQMLGNGLDLELFKNKQKKPVRVDFVSGACMLIRKELLNNTLLPEEYFLQWEDVDFCTYIKRLGYDVVVVPASVVWHKIGLTVKAGDKIYNMISRGISNRFHFFLKYTDGVGKRIAWVVLFSLISFPLYLLHAVIIKKDLRRAKAVLVGFKQGLQCVTHKFSLYRQDKLERG
jgi:hypothetical protein